LPNFDPALDDLTKLGHTQATPKKPPAGAYLQRKASNNNYNTSRSTAPNPSRRPTPYNNGGYSGVTNKSNTPRQGPPKSAPAVHRMPSAHPKYGARLNTSAPPKYGSRQHVNTQNTSYRRPPSAPKYDMRQVETLTTCLGLLKEDNRQSHVCNRLHPQKVDPDF
jgi:hypothetical protein